MRNPVTALFLSLLCVSAAISQTSQSQNAPAENAREQRKLRGLVKTLRSEWCMLSKKPNRAGKYTELAHTLIETVTFDRSGKQLSRIPLLYSCATGALTEMSQKHERSYGDKGRIIEDITSSYDGKLISKTTYEYDPQGRVSALAKYRADGVLQYKLEHEFDEAGNEIKTSFYEQGGSLIKVTRFKFNEQGQIIETAEFDGHGALHKKVSIAFEYDRHGNWIKSIESDFVSEGEKSFFKPGQVQYRAITYYAETAGQKLKDTKKLPEKR
jgi:hypothetical protein